MREQKEIISWVYEEQCFNEPYESFYDILTSPMDRQRGGKGGLGKGTKMMRGGMVGSVGERTASIPIGSRPGQPFSRETEREELSRLRKATAKVEDTMKELQAEREAIDAKMAQIKAST
jgi:YEATS domain-containing protein 4